MRVDIFHCFDKLIDVVASFYLVESLSTLYKIRERLVLADIKHNVDILLIFEVAVESNNVLIVQRAMDFDFAG